MVKVPPLLRPLPVSEPVIDGPLLTSPDHPCHREGRNGTVAANKLIIIPAPGLCAATTPQAPFLNAYMPRLSALGQQNPITQGGGGLMAAHFLLAFFFSHDKMQSDGFCSFSSMALGSSEAQHRPFGKHLHSYSTS